MNTLSRFLSVALLVVGFSSAELGAQTTENVLERFKIRRHGDVLIVPIVFKGKEYQFAFDSGSTATLFDHALPLGEVKQMVDVETPDGPTKISIFAGQKFNVGRLSFGPGAFCAAADLSRLRAVAGYPLDGLIGMDFLGKHVIHIVKVELKLP